MDSTRSFWDVVEGIEPLEKPGHGYLRRVVDLRQPLRLRPDEVFLAEAYALTPFCFDLQRYGELYEFTLCIEVDSSVSWEDYVLQCMRKQRIEDVDPWYVELHRRCFLPISSSSGLPAKDILQYFDWILESPEFRERFESFGMPWFVDRVLFELYR